MTRYPRYKNSGVTWLGDIPEGWEVKRLASYFEERKVKASDKEFAALSVTKSGILPQLDNVAKTSDGDNRKLVLVGDFVINSRSDRKGSSGVSKYAGSVSLINIVLKPRGDIVGDFCNYLLKSNAFVEENYRNGRGIVADLWTTRYDEMKTIKVALPPLPEQEAIVRYLDVTTGKIDKAIAAEERLIELLQERKQIIINEAVGGNLSRAEAQRRRELPKGWEVKRLKSELLANDGGVWGDDPRGNERDTIVLRSTEQNVDGTLSVLEPAVRNLSQFERCKAWLQEGDLIVTKSSGSQEHIGKTSIIDKTVADKGCCYSNFLQRLRVKGKPKYFWYLLNGVITKRQIERMTTTTTGLKNLTGKILGNLEFPLPPLHEQEAIVKYLDEETGKIDRAIEVKRRQIALLRERREIIIDEVVTGKVKVA